MSDKSKPLDEKEIQNLLNNLTSEISHSKELQTTLNNKNQEIFDKETKYFGYLNNSGINNQTGTNTLSNFLVQASGGGSSNNDNSDGPSYNSYGNIIKGFEGFVKNSISLGSGLNTGNGISQQLLQQVDKERGNQIINKIIAEVKKNTNSKGNNKNVQVSAEKIVKLYLEDYFAELPDLTNEKEKHILLNYYGNIKGNFGLDNGFDNGHINTNLFKILKQRAFFSEISTDEKNSASGNVGRASRSTTNNQVIPSKQDVEILVYSQQKMMDGNIDQSELLDDDRIFSLSNAEYKSPNDVYDN